MCKAGWPPEINATAHEVEELYDFYITKHKINRFRDERPKFPSLTPQEFSMSDRLNEIVFFDLNEGGRFIADDCIDSKTLPGVIDLFAEMVTFKHKNILVLIVLYIMPSLLFLLILPTIQE